MSKLHTLTVQDMLWLNLQITKKPGSFNFARLEEATYLQYGHGSSTDIFAQAARFLSKFPEQRPFATANGATVFAACVAFLAINDYELTVTDEDAHKWLANNPTAEEIKAKSRKNHHHGKHGVPDTRAAITAALEKYPLTLQDLQEMEPAHTLA